MSSWHLKRFSKDMCDEVARNPGIYDVQDLHQAISCAKLHFLDNDYGCDDKWVMRIQISCNNELRRRGESEEWD